MKAIFLVPGPDGGFYEYRDVPAPSAKVGLVVFKVRATGTNRGELLARPMPPVFATGLTQKISWAS